MKTFYSFFALIACTFLFLSCQKENRAPYVPTNHLAEFVNEKPQFIDLDTLGFKKIVGKNGTQIIYHRELFDLKETDKVKLELIELYDYNEILYRNIQTVTVDNKLLETSGVLKIVFTSNGKELKLKKGKKLLIYPPKGKLKSNDIFLSETDSLGNIKWRITNQNFTKAIVEVGGGIIKEMIIANDSIDNYYKNTGNDILAFYPNDSLTDESYFDVFFVITENSWNWINIDKFIEPSSTINFELKDQTENFSGFDIYITYKNINSFMHYSLLENELSFHEIPLQGKVNIVVLGEFEKEMFYDKIELNESLNNTELNLNLKKISKEDLKNLFKK